MQKLGAELATARSKDYEASAKSLADVEALRESLKGEIAELEKAISAKAHEPEEPPEDLTPPLLQELWRVLAPGGLLQVRAERAADAIRPSVVVAASGEQQLKRLFEPIDLPHAADTDGGRLYGSRLYVAFRRLSGVG